jgi:DNA-binding CsgD family transcriptional regulator
MEPTPPDNRETKAMSWETVFSYQSVGLAFLRTWSLLAFPMAGLCALQSTVAGPYDLQSSPLRSMNIAHTISLCAFACSLLVAPSLLKRIARLKATRVLVGSLILLEVGTLSLLLGDTGNTWGSLLLNVGAVLTGVASAWVYLGYGISWTRLTSSKQALGAAAASTLFTGLLYSLFVSSPSALMVASLIICPLVAVLILKATPPSLEVQSPRDGSTSKHLLKPIASALAFGFVLGAMRELYVSYVPSLQMPLSLFRMIASILVFLIVWFGLSRHLSASRVYRFGTLGIALGVIAIWFMPSNFALSYAFVLVGELLFSMVIWANLSDVARDSKVSPIYTYGYGFGALYLGYLIGMMVLSGYPAISDLGTPESRLLVIAILMVIITFIFYFGLSELSPAKGHSPHIEPHPFRAKCEKIARSYELTDRQAQVFELLVQGKSVKKMQETLHLSKGTINAHIAHIYRKLDIHSKDEAMEIVENCALP